MTLTQLDTFIRIAETHSFTAASNILGYAQSTVTTQIKQLEEELNCLLFERLGKTVILTFEGEKLLEYAQKMVQLQREIRLEVSPSGEPSGILKIGVSESLCYNNFPEILMKYQKQFPKVEIRLQFISHQTFPVLLKKGALDIVYTLNPYIESPDLTLLYQKREHLGFYSNPDFSLAHKKDVTEKDLESIPLLLTGHECSFRSMLLSILSEKSVTPNIILETSSKEVLKQFAIENFGVTFIPDITTKTEVKNNLLKRIDWHGHDFPIFSQVFIHKDKTSRLAIKELVRMIQEDNE